MSSYIKYVSGQKNGNATDQTGITSNQLVLSKVTPHSTPFLSKRHLATAANTYTSSENPDSILAVNVKIEVDVHSRNLAPLEESDSGIHINEVEACKPEEVIYYDSDEISLQNLVTAAVHEAIQEPSKSGDNKALSSYDESKIQVNDNDDTSNDAYSLSDSSENIPLELNECIKHVSSTHCGENQLLDTIDGRESPLTEQMEIENQQEAFPPEFSNSESRLENPSIPNRITHPHLQKGLKSHTENDDIDAIIEPVVEPEMGPKNYFSILMRVLSFKNRMTGVITTKFSQSDSGHSGAGNSLGQIL